MTARRPLVPVFAPYPTAESTMAANEYDSYDTPEFREDVRSWFAPLPVDWEWVPVTTATVSRAVEDAARAARERPVVVLNLCDGTDDDGFPGVSVVRALESACDVNGGALAPARGWTRKFILPPYEFRAVDALLTNFHLPRTTLLLLVAALAGEESLRRAYAHAVAERYRFYSYGDAMLVV